MRLHLMFRLLNRYPVDVYVTSIQVPYITLSSGARQNIYEGDELDFFEVNIQQVHPINGAWLSFNLQTSGQGQCY